MTFTIALLGLIVATVSLTWNVVQFLLTGGRAKVELVVGVLGAGGVITMPPGSSVESQLQRLHEENGYSQRVVGVVVTNYGRAPIRVQSWGIACKKAGVSYQPIGESIGPELPAMVEPGAQQTWVADAQFARALASSAAAAFQTAPPPVHGKVGLGTGKTLYSRKSLRVA